MNLSLIISQQREFAKSGQARDLTFRKEQLFKLKQVLKQNQDLLFQAIYSDFKKSKYETYLTELALIYQEIDFVIKRLFSWSKPKKIKTDLANFPGKSFIIPEPYGCTLIVGAWNYPYQLTLLPLISAIAAGNTAIIKPSELPINASKALEKIINENFLSGYLYVLQGDERVTQDLLSYQFDKIFFTGSIKVGKIVAKAAAEYLTPVTLELGGKSPCLVFSDADLKITAKRIIWGKFLNAGQTCIAPDYILADQAIYYPLLEELKNQHNVMFGDDLLLSDSYVRIINKKNLLRLQSLINKDKIFLGGNLILAENYMQPTILKDVTFSDAIMQEEIFGPILPVIPFSDLPAIINEIKNHPKPLSLYVFSKNKKLQTKILTEISFGGGCINDVLMHATNPYLPFGGIGASGMGCYHGHYGFKTFSHDKSILKKPFCLDLPLRYPPYTSFKFKLLQLFLGKRHI